jgi:hypothetical protein
VSFSTVLIRLNVLSLQNPIYLFLKKPVTMPSLSLVIWIPFPMVLYLSSARVFYSRFFLSVVTANKPQTESQAAFASPPPKERRYIPQPATSLWIKHHSGQVALGGFLANITPAYRIKKKVTNLMTGYLCSCLHELAGRFQSIVAHWPFDVSAWAFICPQSNTWVLPLRLSLRYHQPTGRFVCVFNLSHIPRESQMWWFVLIIFNKHTITTRLTFFPLHSNLERWLGSLILSRDVSSNTACSFVRSEQHCPDAPCVFVSVEVWSILGTQGNRKSVPSVKSY